MTIDDASGLAPPGWPVPGVTLGCDHDPKQWPKEILAQGVRLRRLFVLNHTITATTIPTRGYDLVSPKETTGSLTVEPGGNAVVREVV